MMDIAYKTTTRSSSRAFSLVELLVVIAVLVILIALTIGLAGGVIGSSRSRAAADTIRVLDQSVEAWTTASGDAVPKDYNGYLIVDGTWTAGSPSDWPALNPSLGLYVAAIGDEDSAVGAVQSIDSSIRSTTELVDGSFRLERTRILDPWGNEIRFVHPAFDGGWGDYFDGSSVQMRGTLAPNATDEFTRSWRPAAGVAGDADEGLCPGGGTRPYFYSAGPDGDPGTIDDNVYSERPQFPAETADIRE